MKNKKHKQNELLLITIAEMTVWLMEINDWEDISPVMGHLPHELHDCLQKAWKYEY